MIANALTYEQGEIRNLAKKFAKEKFSENTILDLENRYEFPKEIFDEAGKLGFFGIPYPLEYGGLGSGLFTKILTLEEFCRKDSSLGIALGLIDIGTELIMKFGSKKQKEKYLRPVSEGKAISAIIPAMDGVKEKDYSDFTLSKTNEHGYKLNGYKDFVLNGSFAKFFIVECEELNKNDNKRKRMFSIIRRDSEGLDIYEATKRLGLRMVPWNSIKMKDVFVSHNDIFAKDNNHAEIHKEYILVSMVKTGAQSLGISQGAFERSLVYAKQREQFKRKIASFQGIRHKLVDMYIKIKALQLMIYNAARRYDNDELTIADAISANTFAQATAVEVTDEALQIFGGSGYMVEMPIEHFYRDARAIRTIIGRQLYQKDAIALSVLNNIL